MKKHRVLFVAASMCGMALSASTFAAITDVNGLRIQLRRFNDYPNSTLVVTPAPPSPASNPQSYGVAGFPNVTINEGPFGAGGFTNQHNIRLSSDLGASNYTLQGVPNGRSLDQFDIKFDITLSVGSTLSDGGAAKEAGFRSDTFVAGESFFIVKTNGEVAAFGGPFPFFSFGAAGSGAYVPGNRAQLRIVYHPDDDPNPTPGDASTLQYFYDNNVNDATPPVASPVLEFSNVENGLITGSDFGMYVQAPPNDNNPNDFANAAFQNIMVGVPEPTAGAILLAGVLGLVRRVRR